MNRPIHLPVWFCFA